MESKTNRDHAISNTKRTKKAPNEKKVPARFGTLVSIQHVYGFSLTLQAAGRGENERRGWLLSIDAFFFGKTKSRARRREKRRNHRVNLADSQN